jgi:hypothetical protein
MIDIQARATRRRQQFWQYFCWRHRIQDLTAEPNEAVGEYHSLKKSRRVSEAETQGPKKCGQRKLQKKKQQNSKALSKIAKLQSAGGEAGDLGNPY